MNESDFKTMFDTVQNTALQGMKSGQDIGYRDGMLRAIAICEERSVLHSQYLPKNHYYKDGDLDQAATCGRRDEAKVLADEIRKALAESRK